MKLNKLTAELQEAAAELEHLQQNQEPETERRLQDMADAIDEACSYIRHVGHLQNHIDAMKNNTYLTGHPEWLEIVKEARQL